MKKLILLLTFVPLLARSDDIFFRSGYILRNVLVVDTVQGRVINVKTATGDRQFNLSIITRINKLHWDQTQAPIVLNQSGQEVMAPESAMKASDSDATSPESPIRFQSDRTVTLAILYDYEAQKKEVGSALFYSWLLPGGGLFYTNDNTLALSILALNIADYGWAYDILSSDNVWDRRSDLQGCIAVAIVLKIGEGLLILDSVDKYNKSLIKRFHLAAMPGRCGFQFSLAYQL